MRFNAQQFLYYNSKELKINISEERGTPMETY